jgi:Flp pilus assembly protein TadG
MKSLKNNHGIVIVYVTLFLMVLGILFFALGVDIGWMVYVKSQGQKATDAAALSGAAAIPNANATGTKTKIDEMATVFNANNAVMNASAGIVSTDVQLCGGSTNPPNCNPTASPAITPANAAGVRVTRTYNTPLVFTRFVNGQASTNLSVSSTAWLGGPGSCPSPGCLPISVCDKEINYNPSAPGGPTCDPTIPIHFSPTGVNNGAWWNLPSAGSTSASQCKGMVNGTIPVPSVGVGDPIDMNNGQITACLQDVKTKFNGCTAAQCALLPTDPARIACTTFVPIVACAAGQPIQMTEPILGFAAICVTNVVATPAASSTIDGTLNCNITLPGTIGGGSSFGIYAGKPVLVQ